jgi:hypothetical protein
MNRRLGQSSPGGEHYDAGKTHESYSSPSQLKQELKEQGIVPRTEP